MTYCCNRDEDLNEQACQSMLYVFILDLQEILGTLLKNNTKDPHRLKLLENGAVCMLQSPLRMCVSHQHLFATFALL